MTVYEHLLPKTDTRIDLGRYGQRLIVFAPWDDSWRRRIHELVFDNNIVELDLRPDLGWPNDAFLMVRDFPHLLAFSIVDTFQISNIATVHELHELRSLGIRTLCKTPINFAAFPHLHDCFLVWRPKCESLFDSIQLESLGLNGYSAKSIQAVARLVNLRELSILNSRTASIVEVASIHSLEHLTLANLRALRSLEGIEDLESIRYLTISGCTRLENINEIGRLKNLRQLVLDNDGAIDSLTPLGSLPRLERFYFTGTTNIRDGDLSVLARLPNLGDLAFQDRRHYSHSSRDFRQCGDHSVRDAAMIALRARVKRIKKSKS